MLKVYGDKKSGNCYKIQLTCALLKIEHQWIDVDIMQNETQTKSYLAKNPNGKVPMIELDDGRVLTESNAIINYLAHNSFLIPTEPFQHALMQQWQCFEQYSHEPCVAVARFIQLYQGMPENRKAEYETKKVGGYKALDVMEQHLSNHAYFAGDSISNADISLFAYTHVAHEGGFDLSSYPNINQWLKRIETTAGFVSMKDSSTR